MKLYQYICDSDEYHSLELPKSVPTSWMTQFDGRSFRASWSPIRLNVYYRNSMGNFSRLGGHLPIFDENAWLALEPLVRDHVEALPLIKPKGDWPLFYMINVTTVLDCLDFAKARVDRFGDGAILNITHYAFRANIVDQIPIFRIKACELFTIIVSQTFRAAVESHGLKGLLWKTLS